LYEPGVSRSLTLFRKATYKDVYYKLYFSLPESVGDPVTGSVSLKFNLLAGVPLIIDFRAEEKQIKGVNLNGKDVIYRFDNEHIIIDERAVKEGAVEVRIDFIAADQSLNRRDDYMYTLLVPDRARTLFPCFDQPDLKARYALTLETPGEWKVVGNSPVEKEAIVSSDINRKVYTFGTSEPLSTYLFSFVAGRMEKEDYERNGRVISIYHRETDPKKIEQCPDIAREVFDALEWVENYTAIPYPFAKYDLIIVPGFQFGGMEHTGATLYNDRRMFLNEQPTLNERLGRSSLIAHETAHMWFGDYVTMEWFDDVWTKEVFANYFAARMVEPLYPEIDHRLNFIRSYYPSAYSEDRTAGTTPIKQPLDNLSDAGLVYGQIIYNKSPIMMEMLVNKIGEEAFKKGIREYLTTFAYGNATWEGLIGILDNLTDDDLKSWSHAWVNEKGMPEIRFSIEGDRLKVSTIDRWKRNLSWPQDIKIAMPGKDVYQTMDIKLLTDSVSLPINKTTDAFIAPNIDGKGYGFFRLTKADAEYCFSMLQELQDEASKGSLLLILYENVLNHTIDPQWYMGQLLKYIRTEKNDLLFNMVTGQLVNCIFNFSLPSEHAERVLQEIIHTHPNGIHRLQAFRSYRQLAKSKEALDYLYSLWDKNQSPDGCQLGENDFISLSYMLAIHKPDIAATIISQQETRISNPDRLKEYHFIAPSVSADKSVRDSVFHSLLQAENRRIEPWVTTVLAHLNHPIREKEAIAYIRPALECLPEIQKTGDIFFPTNWLHALLAGHRSLEAAKEIDQFFMDHPDFHPMLTNKIKQQSDHIYRFITNVS